MILDKRDQYIRSLLERIQKIEKECKEEIKRVFKEEMDKIGEIGEMLKTGEIGGERQDSLLERGEESLRRAA